MMLNNTTTLKAMLCSPNMEDFHLAINTLENSGKSVTEVNNIVAELLDDSPYYTTLIYKAQGSMGEIQRYTAWSYSHPIHIKDPTKLLKLVPNAKR